MSPVLHAPARSDSPGPLAARLSPVPITVLTGFLGAGKTTLLNRILNGDHGLRVAVLVNDFGSVNIDAELVVGVGTDVISLANGCICCSIRDDLVEAVETVIARPEQPEFVLLEASGVADPTGIVATFNNPSLHDRIRLDGIVCVLDAEQVFAAPEQTPLKLWQIACADMLVLNKVDLVDGDRVQEIRAWLDEHFHRYRLIEARHCDVPLDILLGSGGFEQGPDHDHAGRDCERAGCHGHHDGHAASFETWTYEADGPLSLDALRRAAARLPAGVYRCKGIVYGAEAPHRRSVLQVVGKRVEIAAGRDWEQEFPRTRIVAIGAKGLLDGPKLQQAFDGCRVVAPDVAAQGRAS